MDFITTTGSSPRMRGTHIFRSISNDRTGIIPAYAGNTDCQAPRGACFRDHPRVCGEHVLLILGIIVKRGSSPRMRGTPKNRFSDSTPHGIIPAYAGNTAGSRLSYVSARDHPRVCGEHPSAPCSMIDFFGSSPRMRGTRKRFRTPRVIVGIIPAYAGNTSVQAHT